MRRTCNGRISGSETFEVHGQEVLESGLSDDDIHISTDLNDDEDESKPSSGNRRRETAARKLELVMVPKPRGERDGSASGGSDDVARVRPQRRMANARPVVESTDED